MVLSLIIFYSVGKIFKAVVEKQLQKRKNDKILQYATQEVEIWELDSQMT